MQRCSASGIMIHWDPQTYRKPGAIPTGCSLISPNLFPSDRLTKTLRSHVALFLYIYIDHCDVRGKSSLQNFNKEGAVQAQYRPVHLFFPPKTTSRSSTTFIYFFIYFLNLRSKNSGPLALSGSQDDTTSTAITAVDFWHSAHLQATLRHQPRHLPAATAANLAAFSFTSDIPPIM